MLLLVPRPHQTWQDVLATPLSAAACLRFKTLRRNFSHDSLAPKTHSYSLVLPKIWANRAAIHTSEAEIIDLTLNASYSRFAACNHQHKWSWRLNSWPSGLNFFCVFFLLNSLWLFYCTALWSTSVVLLFKTTLIEFFTRMASQRIFEVQWVTSVSRVMEKYFLGDRICYSISKMC